MAPVAVPAGLALGGLWWAWRIYAITTGLAGQTASAPVWFDERQWRHQVRAARGRAAAPGTVPLLTGRGLVAVGATIRAIGHRWRPVLAVPARSFSRHSVIIGSSGSGKTNLMMRLWAGWYAATLATHLRREGDRPLLIVLDCKGGPDARVKAERTRRLLHGVGARRVAIWPDEARLCLWDLPPRDLGVLLLQMIETGDGAAAYYTDIMQTVVNLALAAPGGPPADAASFLDRLDTAWLESAYGDGAHEAAMIRIRAARPHVGDIQLRFATLFGRLGPALDGPGSLAGADVWYCILEGTREQSVAETQAMALTELVAHAATDPGTERRAILLAADDYSAVSRRVPISNLYERGRSLGLGVQVSAQSWQGLGANDDERYRIAATADGGIWLLHTPYPEPVIQLAGTRRVLESAHKLIGATWGDEGTTRIQHAWTADPGLIRSPATPGRPATSTTAAPPSSRSPGPNRRRCRCPQPGHRRSSFPRPPRRPPMSRPRRRDREPGGRARPGSLPVNPFEVLGLPVRADLSDAQVRTAWKDIAAKTHPDRPDGGDIARYTAAATAYAQLRTGWGRSEAYADLATTDPYVPSPAARPARWPGGRPDGGGCC